MRLLLVLLALMLLSSTGGAQAPQSSGIVFPLFVDGQANGLRYRSEFRLVNTDPLATPSVQCTLTQRGTSASFVGVTGERYFADVYDEGEFAPAITSIALNRFLPWEILRSTGQASLRASYASLNCSSGVHAELQVSLFDRGGNKVGEANVLPAIQGRSFEFLIDRRDGTRLGVAIANDSALDGDYAVIARDEFQQEVDRGYATVGAWSQASTFVDELVRLPASFVGSIEVVGVNGSRSYVVGMRFTGPVFTTVSPFVRSTERERDR